MNDERIRIKKLWKEIHNLRKMMCLLIVYSICITIVFICTLISTSNKKCLNVYNEIIPQTETKPKTKQETVDFTNLQPISILQNTEKFTATAYCPCIQCCGKTNGITATGTKATAGRTIAVDPKVIPLGSKVMIDGKEYIAEDVGGAIKGNKVDIYFDSHLEALNFGRRTVNVMVVNEV